MKHISNNIEEKRVMKQETIIARTVKVITLHPNESSQFVNSLEQCLQYCGHENRKLKEMELMVIDDPENVAANKEYIIKIIEAQKTLIQQMSARDIVFCSENSISKISGEGGSDILTIFER